MVFLSVPPVLARFVAVSSSVALRLELGFLRPEPRFLSLFSAGLLSVQVACPSKINGLQRGGCNWQAIRGWELAMRILTDGHKKAAWRAAVCFGDVLVLIGTAPISPAELPTR